MEGKWRYVANKKIAAYCIYMPTVDGSVVPIEHLGVGAAKDTLGDVVCPNGAADKQLEITNLKAQEWISRAEDSM